jgi:hypothetical protein
MKGDATLFMRADQVEAALQLVMPVLKAWQAALPSDFPNYAAVTWGAGGCPTIVVPRSQLAVTDRIGGTVSKGKTFVMRTNPK